MEEISSNNSTSVKRKSITVPTECQICGASAVYSYYGVKSCQPCKVFFKRNAERGREVLKCDYDGNCKIDQNNRHACSYCRLVKCFTSGMQTEMLRSSQSKRKPTTDPVQTTPDLARLNELEKFPILNLLQSDQSTLTVDQWNLLSNLFHCYDEHSALSIGESYMREQNVLPLKLRFKPTSMMKFFLTTLEETQSLYKDNQDFLSLSPDDRSTLLHSTMTYTATLAANCIYCQIGLLSHAAYYNAITMSVHPDIAPTAKRIADRLDSDVIIMKLLLAIFSFSTINYTVYSNTPPVNLSNIKQVLHIQDTYIELTWQYILYKYNYERAVKCFSNFIRCIFAIHDTVVKTQDLQWYADKINSLVQQTEQIVIIND